MSMTQAAEAYFGRVAEEWDTLRAGYFSEAVREAAIAHGYLRPEMAVGDIRQRDGVRGRWAGAIGRPRPCAGWLSSDVADSAAEPGGV